MKTIKLGKAFPSRRIGAAVQLMNTRTNRVFTVLRRDKVEAALLVAKVIAKGHYKWILWEGTAKTGAVVNSSALEKRRTAAISAEKAGKPRNKRVDSATRHNRRMMMAERWAAATGRHPDQHPQYGREYASTHGRNA